MDVYSFQVRGLQVDMTYKKGFVSYVFERDGKTYGQKVKVGSRAMMDIFSAAAVLIINAIEVMEALDKEALAPKEENASTN